MKGPKRELKTALWKASQLLFKRFCQTFMGLGGLLAVLAFFFDLSPLLNAPLRNFLDFFLVTSVGAAFWLAYDLVARRETALREASIPDELQRLLMRAHDDKRYLEVVRLGSQVSRYLWLEGNWKHRVAIGRLVEDAAAKEEIALAQIQALVDDLGWTHVELGDYARANENIHNGVEKAIEAGLHYWAAKGERHLAGLAQRAGDRSQIRAHLEKAREHAQRIQNPRDREQMEVSLQLAFAELNYDEGDFVAALEELDRARAADTDDRDREVKTYSLAGNVHLELEEFQKAKDEFARGYRRCSGLRQDHFAKNAVGLAKVALHDHDFPGAMAYLREAKEVLRELGSQEELNEVETLLRSLPSGTT